MAIQTAADEQQESRNTDDNTARNESSVPGGNVNRRRNDSEESLPQCTAGGICGVNGVLCSSGNVLESMFPYLVNNGGDDTKTTSPRDVRSVISVSNGAPIVSPLTKPIRRGRFLVWPAVIDCGAPLSACGPIPISSSSSTSSE
jgi:hypothetical protein